MVTLDDSNPLWINEFIKNKIKWKHKHKHIKTYIKNGYKEVTILSFKKQQV